MKLRQKSQKSQRRLKWMRSKKSDRSPAEIVFQYYDRLNGVKLKIFLLTVMEESQEVEGSLLQPSPS